MNLDQKITKDCVKYCNGDYTLGGLVSSVWDGQRRVPRADATW